MPSWLVVIVSKSVPSRRAHAAPITDVSRKTAYTSASWSACSAPRAVFSALDLGTNNCRLLIAKPLPRGFRIIDAFSRVVRLGEGLGARGALSQAAMDRAVAALQVCAQKIAKREVTCLRSVATQACRSATNCDEFVARVRAETGLNLDIISPGEEARLAVMGCQALMDKQLPYTLVFDIGGGSTELILVKKEGAGRLSIVDWTSVPWGVVNLTERFGGDMSHDDFCQAVRDAITESFTRFETRIGLSGKAQDGYVQLLGTSGTVTTLASVFLKLPCYNRREVDGLWMETDQVAKISRQVVDMDVHERRRHPCIGNDRADLVVAGCLILDQILQLWPAHRLRVADRGIREGILRQLMDQGEPVFLPNGS